ncbi:FecCD family ABC transporter permease [Novispirillum itersonii]|uniref:Iron complex transport system permease protein n=1 Tax=Novispirillum itersonii TaxID=189 RepID=A0A7W9ZIX5_NOVIT|nr:iron ABC transporter permease [Novispirillum itersonii]MBB6212362.1 iron complex transport system permease protein [Novispirillum itersonii]
MTDRLLISGLLLALLLCAAVSLTSGGSLTAADLLAAGLGQGDPRHRIILLEIRLPRVLLAILVGWALGLGGAALQALLRNPLAEPGLIGVSASAGLGAVIALYFGFGTLWSLAPAACGLTGAGIATALLLGLTRRGDSLSVILSGIALSSLAVALTSLAMALAPNPYALSEMVLWLMGSLKDRSLQDALTAAPLIALGSLLVLSSQRGLRALTLGEEAAATLGIRLPVLYLRVVGGTAAMVGAAVTVAGSIGFVGLLVPHLLRPLTGHDPARLLLPSALGGALLVCAADLVVRLLPTAQELMVGVLTALIGAPFFLLLLRRHLRETLS